MRVRYAIFIFWIRHIGVKYFHDLRYIDLVVSAENQLAKGVKDMKNNTERVNQ